MKKKLAIYSAHSEVVGGDVKYIVELINLLSPLDFDITLFTDRDGLFMTWAKNWLKVPLKVVELPTMPFLFRPNHFERFCSRLSGRSSVARSILGFKIQGAPVSKYLGYLYKLVSLYHARLKRVNSEVFTKLFNENTFDIFWLNNGGYPGKEAGLIACLLAKTYGIKNVLMTFHNVPQARNPFKLSEQLYDHDLTENLDGIIAVSEILKQELISSRGFNPEKIEVHYCGLEDRPLLSAAEIAAKKLELGIEFSRRVLVIAGNLDERRKGHEDLFSAMREVVKFDPRVLLLVVGSGSKERTAELHQRVGELGLDAHVRFLGQRYDIHELNSISEIGLTPSFGSEATPYTIKEAARAGRPSITSTAGGCSEGVVDGETGRIFTLRDTQDLAAKIIEVLRDDHARSRMGIAARLLFERRFRLESQKEIYESILNRASQPSERKT